jgi:Arc/MetJ family transcription regulator
MKTTIDIPEKELKAAMRFTKAKTKREAVNVALAEFNRRRRVEELTKHLGTFTSIMTNEEMEEEQMRNQKERLRGSR